MQDEATAFRELGPERILDAVEGIGFRCDGHLMALNSYENRVYQIGIQDRPPLVAKFYRPGRWSDEQILEEHAFSGELAALEIPVVAPLPDDSGRTLHRQGPYRFALFPRRGGRAPNLEDSATLVQLGRFVARIHNLGATRAFRHRPAIDIASYGIDAYRYLLEQGFIPRSLELSYRSLAEDLIGQVREGFRQAGAVTPLRLHCDCHPGNILSAEDKLHIVDLDDARTGPAVQDLWMFLSGTGSHVNACLGDVLEGYTQFRDFDPRELVLVEPLRTLRMMHFAAWLARRWNDPAFPRAFPYFNTERYWGEHILALREQAALMQEPPLVWD
jgi:Ser/Thr protein kinase RdoA (MazF antagonist)